MKTQTVNRKHQQLYLQPSPQSSACSDDYDRHFLWQAHAKADHELQEGDQCVVRYLRVGYQYKTLIVVL